MEKKDIKSLILIFVLVLVLYFPVLSTYFTGDDFFHYKVSLTDGSLIGFLKLFGVSPISERGYAFYRPIFREGLYNVFYFLFGLNHLPFRVLQFLVHFLNITFVYVLFNKIFKSKIISFLSALFFGISAANVGSLYYLAGGIQAQGALMFVLLTMLLYEKRFVLSLVAFVLSLMSHELAITTPFLLVSLSWLKKKNIFRLFPYFVILILYLYLNFFVIGFSDSEVQYKMNFNPKTILNTLSWYVVWSLGLPEMLVDYVKSGFGLNPDLMKHWGVYFKIIFPAFFGLMAIIVFALLKNLKIFKEKIFWFLVFWFAAGLLPVIFLPIHKKTYYLQVSLPAICGLLAYLLSHNSAGFNPAGVAGKVLRTTFIILFLMLNITSISLAHKTYWSGQRGKTAQKLINDIKSQHPALPKGSTVFVKNDPSYPFISNEWGGTSKQAYFILNGSDALQLLYKDNSLKVYYEDLDERPMDFVEFTAKLQ